MKTFDEAELVNRALELEHTARSADSPSKELAKAIHELRTGGETKMQVVMGDGMWKATKAVLDEFRIVVSSVKTDPENAAEAFRENWLKALSKVQLVPAEFSDYELKWRFVSDLVDLRPALAFVLTLLLNPNKEFSSGLGHCEFEPCGKFFLAARSKAGGRPRIKYCSEEHMLEAHNAGAVKRVQKHRARKARRGK